MRLGDLELLLLSDGTMALDGGAMFGVVPKVIWQRVIQSDASNRIPLGVHCLLVRAPQVNVLIDTGCGEKYTPKQTEIYQIRRQPGLLARLESLGISPAEIGIVINTHLHFDHAGGNTGLRDGVPQPTFPNARYLVQRQELDDARRANERTRASYFPENWEPLVQTGQLEAVEGPNEVFPGIVLEPTPGHTLGHQSIRISSGGRTVYFLGDLCPTTHHVPLPWIMSYDLYPAMTLETRRSVYTRALEQEWTMVFQHDATSPLGRLVIENGGFRARQAENGQD